MFNKKGGFYPIDRAKEGGKENAAVNTQKKKKTAVRPERRTEQEC